MQHDNGRMGVVRAVLVVPVLGNLVGVGDAKSAFKSVPESFGEGYNLLR